MVVLPPMRLRGLAITRGRVFPIRLFFLKWSSRIAIGDRYFNPGFSRVPQKAARYQLIVRKLQVDYVGYARIDLMSALRHLDNSLSSCSSNCSKPFYKRFHDGLGQKHANVPPPYFFGSVTNRLFECDENNFSESA